MKSIPTHHPLNVPHSLMRGAVCATHRHACCRKPLFLPHACIFVYSPSISSNTAHRLESLSAVWKAPFKLSFWRERGVAGRHWGIAKMAAVSEGMKTVTLRYQSFHSVPCPCRGLLCALCCSHTGAADVGCCTCQSVRMWMIICVTDALR